jgi:ribonucleoside-triphosphate reductase (thioredoxin)
MAGEGERDGGTPFDPKALFPETVINSQGIGEPFELGDIARKLRIETGLDPGTTREVSDGAIKKILAERRREIKASHIRDLVCAELGLRGLEREKELFGLESKRFFLDREFIEEYRGRQPDWGQLGYITYKRTYSRLKADGAKEEFWETLRRVVEGCYSIQKTHCHSLQLPWDEAKAQRSARRMFEKAWCFDFLPPGRGLWIMGTDFVRRHGSMALNNCGFVSTENLAIAGSKPFQFVMDALMLGVGVGFDTRGAGKLTVRAPAPGRYPWKVPDSREGWVEGLGRLLDAFFKGGQLPEWDYSLVRPRGSPIKGFGGVASGPDPLAHLYRDAEALLRGKEGAALTSVDIVDLMNFIGRCVVAGNVRRSAQIALGDPGDASYVTMKDPDLHAEALRDRRWASNNSVVVDPDAGFDYSALAAAIAKNGEPGIVWLKNARRYSRMGGKPDWKDKDVAGVNPCGEQSLESWELCCLVETFPSRHDSLEEYLETLKFAYLYAKSVTLMRTHWAETNAVMLKNRRIGCSMSGIVDAFARHGRREVLRWCEEGYSFLRRLDGRYSSWLCVPRSVKITTVKPSGTTSLLPGVSAGIHYPHAEHYLRRIRLAEDSPLVPLLRGAGYPVEPVRTGERAMVVAEFPVREPDFSRGKREASLEMQVLNAVDLQRYWSDNQVSITVSFKPGEAERLPEVLEMCEDKLKSISLLPLTEHGYEQAPYEEITRGEYERRAAEISPIDFSAYAERAEGVRGCDGESCELF